MQVNERSITAADGRALAATFTAPAGRPWMVVVFVGALGVPRRFYGRLAAHLAAEGVASVCYDPRGIGGSVAGPLRADPATLADWGLLDQPAAFAAAAAAWPGLPQSALCHSFGGQALGLYPGVAGLHKAVMVASAVGDLRLFPWMDRLRYTLLLRAALPVVVGLTGYAPRWLGLGEALPPGVPLQWGRWCGTRNYLRGALPAEQQHYEALVAPALFVELTDDRMAPAGPAAALRAWYPNADFSVQRVAPEQIGQRSIGHFGYFRPGPTAPLWAALVDFLRA